MQQALEALERARPQIRGVLPSQDADAAITNLRARLAEPVAVAVADEVKAQALDALNRMQSILMMADGRHPRDVLRAFIQLASMPVARLAEPEPEPTNDLPPMPDPVAWQVIDRLGKERSAPLFAEWQMRSYARVAVDLATPPARPLTDEEADALAHEMVKGGKSVQWLVRAIERAHKITGGNDE